MSALRDVCVAVAANAENCTGIRQAYPHISQVSSTPAVVVTRQRVNYDTTFEESATYVLNVLALVQVGEIGDAQDTLDDLLETSGAGSLIEALSEDLTVGSETYSTRVTVADNFGIVEYGGTEFLGVSLNVEVHA